MSDYRPHWSLEVGDIFSIPGTGATLRVLRRSRTKDQWVDVVRVEHNGEVKTIRLFGMQRDWERVARR